MAAQLQIDGLTETMNGLRKADRAVANEVRKIMRDNAKTVAVAARKVRAHRSQPSRSSYIQWRADRQGAAVVLNPRKDPRAKAVEFGADTHNVFGRRRPMRYMDAATFRPNNDPSPSIEDGGYVIQPTIRRMLPQFTEALGDDIVALYRKLVARG